LVAFSDEQTVATFLENRRR